MQRQRQVVQPQVELPATRAGEQPDQPEAQPREQPPGPRGAEAGEQRVPGRPVAQQPAEQAGRDRGLERHQPPPPPGGRGRGGLGSEGLHRRPSYGARCHARDSRHATRGGLPHGHRIPMAPSLRRCRRRSDRAAWRLGARGPAYGCFMADPNLRLDLAVRPRRTRRTPALRSAVRETSLSSGHLIQPLFVHEDAEDTPLASLPGQTRWSLGGLVGQVGRCLDAGVDKVVLFPKVPEAEKTPGAEAAFDAGGLVPRAVAAVKERHPAACVITDVALDPYSSDGHDGLIDAAGEVDNDPDRGRAREAGRRPSRRGGGRGLPERHDGRPRRRDPRRAGRRGSRPRRDPRLHGEVRLGLLRALPRRAGLGPAGSRAGEVDPR